MILMLYFLMCEDSCSFFVFWVCLMSLIYCMIYNIAVAFRNRERITFDHLVSMKKPNEKALVKVLRDGKEQEFSITLRPVRQFYISFN